MTELEKLRDELNQALAIGHAHAQVIAALIHSLPKDFAAMAARELAEQLEKSIALGLASSIQDPVLDLRDGLVRAFLDELQNQK